MIPSLDFISDDSVRESLAGLLQLPSAEEPEDEPYLPEVQRALEEIAVMRALHKTLLRLKDRGDDVGRETLVRDMMGGAAAAAAQSATVITTSAQSQQPSKHQTKVLPFALYQLQKCTSKGYYEVRNSLTSHLATELWESVDKHIADGSLADSMLALVPLLEMVWSDELLKEEQRELCIGMGEISLKSKGLQQLPEDPQRQSQDGDHHVGSGSLADHSSATLERVISAADIKLMSVCDHAARSLAKSISTVYRLAPSCISTPNTFVEHRRALM